MTEWNRNFKYKKFYSRFQITFHCNIPNFVAKFGNSLRSSKVHFRIHKAVCKQRLWLVPELNEANQTLSLQTGLRILKSNTDLAINFRTSRRIWNLTLKSRESICNIEPANGFVCESIIVIASLAAQYVLMPAIHDNRKLLIVLRWLTIVNCRLCDQF